MNNSNLFEPLLEKNLNSSNVLPQLKQVTASTPRLFTENGTEPELLSLKQAVISISAEFEKKLPHAVSLPFSVEEMIPFSDQIHYLVSTREGTILYLNISTQSFNDKKISAGPFSIVVLENEKMAYFSRENEILCISIPSLELKLFQKFEGKRLICLKDSWDKKSLIAHFDNEITSISFSDPREAKSLIVGNFTSIAISNKGHFALISSEDQLVLLSSKHEKIGEVAIDPKSLKLKYSPQLSMIIISYITKIVILNAETLENIQNIKMSENEVGVFSVTNDEHFILFPDNEVLHFYDLRSFQDRETVNVDNFQIKFIAQSMDNRSILINGPNSKFYVLPFPVFEYQKSKDIFWAESLDRTRMIIKHEGYFKTWDFETDKTENIVEVKIGGLEVKDPENFIVWSRSEVGFSKINIPTKSISNVVLDKNSYEMIRSTAFSPDKKFFTTGTEKRVFLWDFESLQIIKEFKGHDTTTWTMCFLTKSNAIAGMAQNCSIRIWDIETTKEIAVINENTNTYSMNITHNEEILILVTIDSYINIWDWRKNIRLHSIKGIFPAIVKVMITEDDRFMIGYSRDGKVRFFSLETFNLIFSYKFENMIWIDFLLGENHIFYIYKAKTEVLGEVTEKTVVVIKENPLKVSKITCAGPGNEYEYMKYVSKLLKSKEVDYNPLMDEWIIFPYMINTLHLYAYCNYPNHLKKALKNGSSMINSIFNKNPLSIAMLKGFKNCISSVILTLDNYLVIHPYSLKNLSIDGLIKLNLSSCSSLVTFYESIFRKDVSEHLAKFCCTSTQLPVQFLSKNIYIETGNLLNKEALREQEKPIVYISSHILLDMAVGSQKSIDFLYSIHGSPNPSIMMTSLIQEIIHYKWRKLSWVMHLQALVYIVYMLLLSFYVLYFIENDSVLFILFGESVIISLYEAYQLWASPLSYIKDLWNYVDIARTISSILYFVIYLASSTSTIRHDVLSFLVIISWMRGIAYFRVFSNTRYMVNLISEVIKDMATFLILLSYSTISFAFIFLVLDSNNPQFIDYLKISYRFDVGDFDTTDMNSMQWICFFLVSMINMIVMLNLLIAIIGDTFEKVQENYLIADTHELLNMIIEIETMLIKNRNASDPCYFQICIEDNSDEMKGEESRFSSLKKYIKALQVENAKTNEEISNVKTLVENNQKEMRESFEKLSLAISAKNKDE